MRTEIVKVIPTHRIKIIKSNKPTYWYSNITGDEFEVIDGGTDGDNELWEVVDGSQHLMGLVIDRDDTVLVCEILKDNHDNINLNN